MEKKNIMNNNNIVNHNNNNICKNDQGPKLWTFLDPTSGA